MGNKKLLIAIIIGLLVVGVYSLSKDSNKPMSKDSNKPIQSHRSYEIEVIEKPSEIKVNEPVKIGYKIKNDKGEVVKDFAIAHEKIMHFIVVRKDLAAFQHLHPDFDQKIGEFKVEVTFASVGHYRFFADFTPGNDNPQRLPVTVGSDIDVGDVSAFQNQPLIPDIDQEKTMADYQIIYEVSGELKAQVPETYKLVVTKNHQPVDLEKYLGALGHSVVIKEGSLDYIHTHAGEAGVMMDHGMGEGNEMSFSVTFPETGVFKIFTQFQYEGKGITTDYVVKVN